MELRDYLKYMVDHDGSDLYLSTGASPSLKINGLLKKVEDACLPAKRVKELAYKSMDKNQIRDFENSPEMNLALSESGYWTLSSEYISPMP